ncbi:MAG: MOP flippase family protein [Candidatus Woesearchaeota archaeon]
MSSFRKTSVFALKWAFISKLGHQILHFAASIILARILAPEDFGIIGMVSVFTSFAMIFSNFGFGNAIIQKKEATKKEVDTVFWLNFFLGVLLLLLFYFLFDKAIANFYNDNRLIEVTQIIAFVFLLRASSAIPMALLTKNLRFKEIGIATIIAFVISTGIAITMALNGYGYISLAYREIINAAILLVLVVVILKYYPKHFFSWTRLKPFIKFGTNLTGNRILTQLMRRLDNLLIGKMLGQYELGLYDRSYKIMMFPLQNISNVIKQVMFPAFSSIQENRDKIKSVYLKVTQAIAYVTFPLIIVIFVLSHIIVYVLLGEKWMEMVPVLRLLVLVAIPQVILTLNGTIYQAIGKPHIPFRLNSIQIIFLILSFYFGIKLMGLTGLIIGYLFVNIIFFYPVFYFAAREIHLKFREQMYNLKWIVLNSIIIGLLIYVGDKLMIDISEYIRFFTLIPFAVIIYLVLSYFQKDKMYITTEGYLKLMEIIKRK